MTDIKNVIRILRTNCPGPYEELVGHIEELEKTADETLASAIPNKIMRQNQGKVQILRELLLLLRG